MTGRARTIAVVSTIGLVAAGLAAAPALASPPPGAVGHGKGHKIEFPTIEAAAASRAARGAAGTTVNGSGDLTYGGGVNGVGVTTGTPRVYVVFWGSQWGTQTTDSTGNLLFSGDSKGLAPYLQKTFKAIGTESGTSTWSGVMTQYCEGVATGTITCPSGSAHVGLPHNGAFAGAWYDGTSAAPNQATDHEIGVEAHAALAYFRTLGAVDVRNAQFVVVSPTGTHPGGFNTNLPNTNFCAWHDWNGDTTLNGGAIASPEGDFAFTNLPYLTDLGFSCGANYVNLIGGSLDGVSIVAGHEYAETITDMFPNGGWLDSQTYENADKCAWVGTGGTGGAQNVTFATGRFPMQGTYSNDGSACLIAHPIVTNSTTTNTVTMTQFGPLSGIASYAITSFTVAATDTGSQPLSFSATGLPSGVSVDAGTGQVSGTPTRSGFGTFTVTASDGTGASDSKSASWTVDPTTVTINPLTTLPVQTPHGSRVTGPTMTGKTTASPTSPLAALTWSATGLPSGISIGSSTGTFTGRAPRRTGNYTVTVTLKDGTGSSATYPFTWLVT